MNHRTMPFTRVRLVICTLAVLALAACGTIPSMRETGENVLKEHTTLSVVRERMRYSTMWDNPAYHLPNGNPVYVQKQGKGYHCDRHWEAASDGYIIGYATVGSRCTGIFGHRGIKGWRRWVNGQIVSFPDEQTGP